uniref:Uncharacterized protein n=1 Tax=Anguilla anguilla TaxID=7936 RepID=A0A0E9SH47_ANGAN
MVDIKGTLVKKNRKGIIYRVPQGSILSSYCL